VTEIISGCSVVIARRPNCPKRPAILSERMDYPSVSLFPSLDLTSVLVDLPTAEEGTCLSAATPQFNPPHPHLSARLSIPATPPRRQQTVDLAAGSELHHLAATPPDLRPWALLPDLRHRPHHHADAALPVAPLLLCLQCKKPSHPLPPVMCYYSAPAKSLLKMGDR
jgi:hypothetical protein